MMASNPVAFAQKRKQPELAPAPPPVVTKEVTGTVGEPIEIPLGIYGARSRQLEFLIRARPKIGKLSAVTATGANSATVTYTAPADTDATEDKFAYAVRSGEGVSAPGIVTIKLIPKPMLPGRLEVPDRLSFPSTVLGKETGLNFEITNPGSGPVTGEVTVSSPWVVEGNTAYRVEPKGRVAMRLIFRPDKAGTVSGDVVFGPNPRKVISLSGEGKAPVEVRPARLKLATSEKGRTRTGSIEIENVSDEPRTIALTADARLMTEKSVEVAPHSKVQVPVFAEPGDGTNFEDVVHLSAGDWKAEIPVEVEALMQRLKLAVGASAGLRGMAGLPAEFPVIVENEGGRATTAKLAVTAPFSIGESNVALAPGEKKQVKVSCSAVPEGEHAVEITAENDALVQRIKVQFAATAGLPTAGKSPVQPSIPRLVASANAATLPNAETEAPEPPRAEPPSLASMSPADIPNRHEFPAQEVTSNQATLVWPASIEAKEPLEVQERRLIMTPNKSLQVNWVRIPNVTFNSEGKAMRAKLAGLAPAKLYTVRVVGSGQTLFTTQFSTKEKPPLLPFGWRTIVLTALAGVLCWLVWKKWKNRQPSGW